MSDLISVGILGTGAAFPEKVLTNHDLEKMVDTSDEWITTRTGVKERRIASDKESASDFGIEASKKALEMAGLTINDIDLIICASFTGDTQCPSTACHIQHGLGSKTCGAVDVNAACTGFIYGLSMARALIQVGTVKKAIVVGTEAITKFTDFQDRGTCVLFGDGAGAMVIGEVEKGKGIISDHLGADSSMKDAIIIPAGGSRKPASHDSVDSRDHYIKMEGNDVFKFAVRILSYALDKALEGAGMKPDQLDWIFPHQANIRIIDAAAKKFNLPKEKVWVNINKYGNTSAATVPTCIDEAIRTGKFTKGQTAGLVAFGGGLTWGASILKY